MLQQKNGGPATNGTTTKNHTTKFYDHSNALARRRRASHRCQPLDCGCRVRDPWVCRCHDPELTEHQIEAAIEAAEFLLDHGLTPLFTIPVRRALWRVGRRDLATLTEVGA